MYKLLLISAFASVLLAGDAETKRLQASADVLSEIMGTADKGIPQDLFEKAQCAIVVPGMKKAGFVFGAKYGRGFASCRMPDGKGWTGPVGIRVEGGSVGFQIGGAESDIILLVMNQKGMERVLSNKFTLGGEATAAAGPVGRESQAQTDLSMRAEMLSWSRSRGLFGGIALQGATMREDSEVDKELYGGPVDRQEVLRGKKPAPAAAAQLLLLLSKYSAFKGK